MYKKNIGNIGEEKICEYLLKNGYTILKRNYFCRGGEIDIIAQKDMDIAFVEVKTRRGNKFGTPAEAVTKRKMEAIKNCAYTYINETEDNNGYNYTFDVAEVTLSGEEFKINYIRNAFYE